MASYPEVETVVNEIGRPDDGTDSDGYYNSEFFVPLRPQKRVARRGRGDGLAAPGLRRQTAAHQGGARQCR